MQPDFQNSDITTGKPTANPAIFAELVADTCGTATFLIRLNGFLVYANAAGRRFLVQSRRLVLQKNLLRAPTHASESKLLGFFNMAAEKTGAAKARALCLWNGHDHLPLQLIITPLSEASKCATGVDLVLYASDTAISAFVDQQILRDMFGLSSSEAAVANCILAGLSLANISTLRKVAIGTTRNQLKSVLARTRTRRQSELVRLLMALPRYHPSQNSGP